MKKYAIDVHWVVGKCYEVEANSREEAVNKINKMLNGGNINVHRDGFEATDDVEVNCVGEENDEGNIEYD